MRTGPSSDILDPVPILCQRCLGRIAYDTKEARGSGRTKEQNGTGPTVVAAAVVLALYLVSFSTNQWSGQESRAEFETSRGSGPSWDKGMRKGLRHCVCHPESGLLARNACTSLAVAC